jgi:hypothetical protein
MTSPTTLVETISARSYRAWAGFEPASGSGQRVGKRKCDFRFRRVQA